MSSRMPALSALALAFLGFSLTTSAEPAALRERVDARLARLALPAGDQIQVHVNADHVVLTGQVSRLDLARKAVRLAHKETRSVENRLQVRPPRGRTDDELRAAVLDTILRYPQTTPFDDYSFTVEDGQVTLLGSVQRPFRRGDIEARVARIEGVRALENRIDVQPVSIYDDELRLRLFKAIYASGRFVHYGGPNPSVRLIVKGGRVTLTGVVVSRVDQIQIGFIARSIVPFGVDNQLVIESEQRRREPAPRASGGSTRT
jgi:osmotically-inducible protein OsmY